MSLAANEDFNELASKYTVTLPPLSERRRLRIAFQVSQTRLAEALKVSRRTVHAWETGEADPTGENRERYAEILALWRAREQEEKNRQTDK